MINVKNLSKDEILSLIRERLSFSNNIDYLSNKSNYYRTSSSRPGLGIEMSGYNEDGVIGSCSKYNNYLLSLISDFGIYERVNFLYIDAYKGLVFVYFSYWGDDDSLRRLDFGGDTTTGILYEIVKATCIDNPCDYRRRD